MIEAYVDGRPIPRSSSVLTRLASVYRAGGLVAWPDGVELVGGQPVALGQARQPALGVVGLPAGLVVDRLDVGPQEPGERDRPAGGGERALLTGRRRAR